MEFKIGFIMRIRRAFFVIAALVAFHGSSLCWAQDSWAAYVQGWRESKTERRSWTLRVRKGDQKDTWWRRDEGLARLVADRELSIELLDQDASVTLWKVKEWGNGAHWLLMGRSGDNIFEGEGIPKGEDILAAIHNVEERTLWEQREAFLKEHPEHGEALEARLATSRILAMDRFRVLVEDNQARPFRLDNPGAFLLNQNEPGQIADGVFAEMVDTLERLNGLPDGWRLSPASIFGLGLTLKGFDAGASPRMRATLHTMRDAALAEWARNPNREGAFDPQTYWGPQELWISCTWVLDGGTITSLPKLTPSPGQTFPQNDLLIFVANAIRDPQALLDFLEVVPAEPPDGPLNSAQWKAFRFRQAGLSGLFARAYAQQGRWGQATLALQECRNWSGSSWKGMGLLREFDKEPSKVTEPAQPANVDGTASQSRKENSGNQGNPVDSHRQGQGAQGSAPPEPMGPPIDFLDLLRSDPAPDLPPPSRALPIRMVLWGSPSWAEDWLQLPKSALLAPWSVDEIRWEAPSLEEEAALARFGLQPPRWIAFQGPTTILASGQVLPDPRLLALQLSVAGQTRLQQLDRFIRQNPDHLDARRERFGLLRPRMPFPVLESVLAEDAARAWIPLDFDRKAPWLSNSKVWEQQAAKLMPSLEAALGRWPSSRKLWRIWIAWLPFRPTPISPYAFSLDLAVPRPRGEWLADLPKEVHLAVAAELRTRARFDQMRDWFQSAWDVAALRKDDPAGNFEVLYKCLAESMSALRLDGALQQLKKHYPGPRESQSTP